MKELLQQVKDILERSFENPNEQDLDFCLETLMKAKESAGEKQEMFENIINAVTHAKHAQAELEHAGTPSASAAYGQAYRALDKGIESYLETNNDPY
ncbi:hypothetical protein D0469_18200 [Peribacillus saganii]|uniref:Uncharacterized protein n=1 Tax=Peribacillus saganii TaxID=2303992 RepID=A0A372LE29_9BACI|nr:hypothetical protein [Peribacillus saganii]RFU64492.1 hypothetical protein D0469_18200 [Peribacillus saganii]